jgi:hypothetical protein
MHKMLIGSADTGEVGRQTFTWNGSIDNDTRWNLRLTDCPLVIALRPMVMSLQTPAAHAIDFEIVESVEAIDLESISTEFESGPRVARFITSAAAPMDYLDDKIVVEDELANDIIISLQVDDKTVTEIIDLMSLESGCNIYIYGDKIVVDACGF